MWGMKLTTLSTVHVHRSQTIVCFDVPGAHLLHARWHQCTWFTYKREIPGSNCWGCGKTFYQKNCTFLQKSRVCRQILNSPQRSMPARICFVNCYPHTSRISIWNIKAIAPSITEIAWEMFHISQHWNWPSATTGRTFWHLKKKKIPAYDLF